MLILLRHGRTGHNASRRLLGRLDPPLDQLGVRQAASLAGLPVLSGVTRLVASPLLRTRQTAEAIGLPVELDDRWLELDYGIHDGRPLDEVPASVWDSWAADPAWAPEGGESLAALGRRVHAACDELWAESDGADVAVVTHVSPIKAAIGWALGLSPETQARLFVEVASIHRIGAGRAGGPSLLSLNEIGHRPSR